MEFINVEEFLKLPLEVQKVLTVTRKGKRLPLVSDYSLKKFIEDKAKLKVNYKHSKENTLIFLTDKNSNVVRTFEDMPQDLLQSYWKVAIKIAKEEVERNKYLGCDK